MTILESIQMLHAVRDIDAVQAKAENMGGNTALYEPGVRRVAEPIVERYQPGRFGEFWATYRAMALGLGMKFSAGDKQEGASPSGGTWAEWDAMDWSERLVSLSDEFFEEWVSEYKDLTLADDVLTNNGDITPLARHVRNIITGGNTHSGQAGLFASERDPTSIAAVAGIHSKTGTMFSEVLAAWMVFMLTDPDGVVKRVAKSFQDKVAERVSTSN